MALYEALANVAGRQRGDIFDESTIPSALFYALLASGQIILYTGPYVPPNSTPTYPGGTDRTQKVVGPRVAFLGDSITAQQSGPNIWDMSNWTSRILWMSNGQLIGVKNAGVAGNQSGQMLTRLQSDIIAVKPDICVILAGTNDIGPAVDTVANLAVMCGTLRANGVQPVICTIPPVSTGHATYATHAVAIPRMNARIRDLAARTSVPLIDMYAVLVSKLGDGALAAAYNTDTVHPNGAGSKVMAEAAFAVIASLPISPVQFGVPTYSADGDNLLGNGLFTTGSANYPTGWAFGGGTGGTATRVIDGVNSAGYVHRLTGTGALWYSQSAAASVPVGNIVRFSARMKWTPADLLAGGTVRFQNAGHSFTIPAAMEAFGPTSITIEGPSLVAAPYGQVIVNSGVGALEVSQIAAYNITALGL